MANFENNPKSAPDKAGDREGVACRRCGKPLTGTEIEFYETACEGCEQAEHQQFEGQDFAALTTGNETPSAEGAIKRINGGKGVSIELGSSEYDCEAYLYEEPFPGMVVVFGPDGLILSIDIEDLSAEMAPPPPGVSPASPTADSPAPAPSGAEREALVRAAAKALLDDLDRSLVFSRDDRIIGATNASVKHLRSALRPAPTGSGEPDSRAGVDREAASINHATDAELREILGLEDDEPLAVDDFGEIRTCSGAWQKTDWVFVEDEGLCVWRVEREAALQSAPIASAAAGPVGTGLTLTALHQANIDRQAEWCPDQVPDLSFRGNELAGETGEACNVIKKLERERQGWRGSRATLNELAEELADVVICADLCAVTAGIDLSAAVVAKFNATSDKVGISVRLATPTPDPHPVPAPGEA